MWFLKMAYPYKQKWGSILTPFKYPKTPYILLQNTAFVCVQARIHLVRHNEMSYRVCDTKQFELEHIYIILKKMGIII